MLLDKNWKESLVRAASQVFYIYTKDAQQIYHKVSSEYEATHLKVSVTTHFKMKH